MLPGPVTGPVMIPILDVRVDRGVAL
jgi:hypothetical protein